MSKSGQQSIRENRKPRVHIEYEVTTYGSKQKVELPFVMGVMSDLSGKSLKEKDDINDREFEEFDVDNFERKMAGIAPRAAFRVANKLTGEGGEIGVDMTFESMDDFSPGAIAKNWKPVRELLEARQDLSDLLAYMDGKSGAQELLDKLLANPELMKALAEAKAARAAAGDDTKSKG